MNSLRLVTVIKLCLLAGLALAQQPAHSASQKLPDTVATQRLLGFLEAFNTGDVARMRAFHQKYSSAEQAEQNASMDAEFYADTGGVDLHNVLQSSDYRILVLVITRRDQNWLRLSLEVASGPPHAIVGLGLREASPPAGQKPGEKLTEAEVTRKLQEHVERLAKEDRFSGAVLVAKNGQPLFKRAYGSASVAFQVPNRVDTKFNLASMGKMFTGVAVAQLAEQGKLSFDDLVGKHLPDYSNKAVASKVTIHHLLTHTSGMASYWNDKFEAAKDKLRKVQDFVPFFVDDPLQFEPGEKWAYSNAGYIVLGVIIEKISGEDYYDYLRKRIFKPAGMINTDCYELDLDTPNLALGYTRMGQEGPQPGARRNNLFLHGLKGGPAGGGFSTVEDLLRFDIALRGHKLLSAKYTDLLLTGKVKTDPEGEDRYAYGFDDRRANGKKVVGHSGGFPGVSSILEMHLDSGYTVAVLSNYDNGSQAVMSRLRPMLSRASDHNTGVTDQ